MAIALASLINYNAFINWGVHKSSQHIGKVYMYVGLISTENVYLLLLVICLHPSPTFL